MVQLEREFLLPERGTLNFLSMNVFKIPERGFFKFPEGGTLNFPELGFLKIS